MDSRPSLTSKTSSCSTGKRWNKVLNFKISRTNSPKSICGREIVTGKSGPTRNLGPNGGTQFTVGYPLLNGCHACARAGMAIFNWNFDAQGKFLGTTFQG
jgi:hypothetical protein